MAEYPCKTCTRVKEPENRENKLCQQWQLWFFERWEEINTYYKAHKNGTGGQKMNSYENQKQVDELQKIIDATAPGIKIRCFSVTENRVLSAIIDIDSKGNKSVIDKLISIGFRKVCRYKKPLPFYAPMTTKDTFVIRLEKAI